MPRHEPHRPDFRQLCDHLQIKNPEDFFHVLQHTLRRTYRLNSERYDESVGDDMGLYGFSVYKNSWFQLEHELARFSPSVVTGRPNNSLTISTPGPDLKVYRGGADENFDIESYDLETGSITKKSIVRRNRNQLSLFDDLPDDGDDDEDHEWSSLDLDSWVAVHSGNPESGLANIWIGAPRGSTGQGESQWAFVAHLPDLCGARGCEDGGTSSGVSVEPGPAAPTGPTHIQRPEPEVVVERRQANKADDAE